MEIVLILSGMLLHCQGGTHMMQDTDQKVTNLHPRRNAYLYIRQSTLRQVFENTESTKRQYGLRQKAMAPGWPEEHIFVNDTDLGQSGAPRLTGKAFNGW